MAILLAGKLHLSMWNEETMIETLSCDNTIGGNTTLKNPKWSDVENSIRNMNGESLTMVGLMLNDSGQHMMIGGGPEEFVVNINIDEMVYFLIDANNSEDEYKEIMAGQPSEYPENQIVDLNTVLVVAKYYFEAGRAESNYEWLEC
jgi:hypothetical protein